MHLHFARLRLSERAGLRQINSCHTLALVPVLLAPSITRACGLVSAHKSINA